jgi:hypothetical protein
VNEELSDQRLEDVLASVGEHLVVPGTEDSDLASLPSRSRWGSRLLAYAAVALVVALVASVAVPPVREAVADWLGLGSTRIERVPAGGSDPSGLPPIDAGLPPVSQATAEAVLGRPLPTVESPELARPDHIAVPPEGGVLLAWDHGETTLWARATDDDPHVLVEKLLDEYDTVESVDSLGEAAALIEAEHVLRTPHRRLAADTVVLWLDDGLEYRLESSLDSAALLSIARSVHAERER